MGIGDWGFGDWPNPQSPIPILFLIFIIFLFKTLKLIKFYYFNYQIKINFLIVKSYNLLNNLSLSLRTSAISLSL